MAISKADKLKPIHADDRETIYIFGYPRNGTKYAQWMFAEAINAPALTWSEKQDLAGDPGALGLDRDGPYKVRHSHWNAARAPHGPKMALIVRDPRDAILSIKRTWKFADMDHCVGQFCGYNCEYKPLGVFSMKGWPGYVLDWLERGVPWVRYEDLLETPERTLLTLMSNLDIPFPEPMAVLQAIANNRFDPTTQSVKGQKGISGRWRTELDQKYLSLVEKHCAEAMEVLGYE